MLKKVRLTLFMPFKSWRNKQVTYKIANIMMNCLCES